jgi:hypothetical protein
MLLVDVHAEARAGRDGHVPGGHLDLLGDELLAVLEGGPSGMRGTPAREARPQGATHCAHQGHFPVLHQAED